MHNTHIYTDIINTLLQAKSQIEKSVNTTDEIWKKKVNFKLHLYFVG